jgi:hypothetical protein
VLHVCGKETDVRAAGDLMTKNRSLAVIAGSRTVLFFIKKMLVFVLNAGIFPVTG